MKASIVFTVFVVLIATAVWFILPLVSGITADVNLVRIVQTVVITIVLFLIMLSALVALAFYSFR